MQKPIGDWVLCKSIMWQGKHFERTILSIIQEEQIDSYNPNYILLNSYLYWALIAVHDAPEQSA